MEVHTIGYKVEQYRIKVKFERINSTAKQAVTPGTMSWMCPETAFSATPDSYQVSPSSLQAALMAILAS